MSYQVRIARSARKEISQLPKKIGARVSERISTLAEEPRPAGCLKLSGDEGLWRVRVGDYRILYYIDDSIRVVAVEAVRHRRDAYR